MTIIIIYHPLNKKNIQFKQTNKEGTLWTNMKFLID